MNTNIPAAANINTTRTAIGMESPVFGAVFAASVAVVASEVLAAAVVAVVAVIDSFVDVFFLFIL